MNLQNQSELSLSPRKLETFWYVNMVNIAEKKSDSLK